MKDAIDGHNLTLRRAKSGEGVKVYRPGFVTKALERITQPDQAHFFWSGTSLPVTAAHYWRSRLNLVARRAGVKDFRPHRLRDTFAVEALLAGVSMQNVSALPGHGSVSTTEQYYAAWKVARRDRLARIVRKPMNAICRCCRSTDSFTTITTRGPLPRPPFNSPVSIPTTPSSSVNQDV